MTEKIKETLSKQFDFLAQRSANTYGAELADLTNAMINLALFLESDEQNLSFYAAGSHQPD